MQRLTLCFFAIVFSVVSATVHDPPGIPASQAQAFFSMSNSNDMGPADSPIVHSMPEPPAQPKSTVVRTSEPVEVEDDDDDEDEMCGGCVCECEPRMVRVEPEPEPKPKAQPKRQSRAKPYKQQKRANRVSAPARPYRPAPRPRYPGPQRGYGAQKPLPAYRKKRSVVYSDNDDQYGRGKQSAAKYSGDSGSQSYSGMTSQTIGTPTYREVSSNAQRQSFQGKTSGQSNSGSRYLQADTSSYEVTPEPSYSGQSSSDQDYRPSESVGSSFTRTISSGYSEPETTQSSYEVRQEPVQKKYQSNYDDRQEPAQRPYPIPSRDERNPPLGYGQKTQQSNY